MKSGMGRMAADEEMYTSTDLGPPSPQLHVSSLTSKTRLSESLFLRAVMVPYLQLSIPSVPFV